MPHAVVRQGQEDPVLWLADSVAPAYPLVQLADGGVELSSAVEGRASVDCPAIDSSLMAMFSIIAMAGKTSRI
jgi:hypothetical protein